MALRLLAQSARIGVRSLTQSVPRGVRLASGGSEYNEPTGNLFAEKQPAPGKKRAKEDWEDLWTYGMFGGMLLGAVLIFYKPDTSIQTWSMKEAKKRLEGEGKVWKYEPSPNSGHPNGV